MTTHLALLRGINVGGRSKVPMGELRSLVEHLGHENVRTYLQSGNVIFESRTSDPKKIAAELERTISKSFNLKVSVLMRSYPELERVVEGNPFPTEGVKPTSLHVMFLAELPSRTAIKALDPNRSPPDEFGVKGGEIYLSFPRGSGRSKLTIDYFEQGLGTRATARNWNTVTKVLELMART